MNNNLLTTRWRLLRSEDLLLEREVRAVDRSHVAAERAREFDAPRSSAAPPSTTLAIARGVGRQRPAAWAAKAF